MTVLDFLDLNYTEKKEQKFTRNYKKFLNDFDKEVTSVERPEEKTLVTIELFKRHIHCLIDAYFELVLRPGGVEVEPESTDSRKSSQLENQTRFRPPPDFEKSIAAYPNKTRVVHATSSNNVPKSTFDSDGSTTDDETSLEDYDDDLASPSILVPKVLSLDHNLQFSKCKQKLFPLEENEPVTQDKSVPPVSLSTPAPVPISKPQDFTVAAAKISTLPQNRSRSPKKSPQIGGGSQEIIFERSISPDETMLETPDLPKSKTQPTLRKNQSTIPETTRTSPDSFNSTIHLKDSSKNASILKKQKQPWFDPDASTKSKRSQKSKNSFSGPKTFRQPKLLDVTEKMASKIKVDISSLKDFSGGSLSQSQSLLSNFSKRKSDETIENVEKREKLSSNLSRGLSGIHISPMKNEVGEPFIDDQRTPPTSPIVGRTSKTNRNKPLSPSVSDNEIKLQDEIDANHKKSSTITGHAFGDETLDLIKNFDKVPIKDPEIPKFRFQEPVVRNKAERAKLQGWSCAQCKEYYDLLASQMDEKEIQRIKNNCSRHRSKYQPVSNTPANFWCTIFPTTQELYEDGHINVGTPFDPKPRPRRRRYSDSGSENNNVEDDDFEDE